MNKVNGLEPIDVQLRLDELDMFASVAGKIEDMMDGSDGYLLDRDAIQEVVSKDLIPFLRTLKFRLPEIRQMLRGIFEWCPDCCPFDEVEEPEPDDDAE